MHYFVLHTILVYQGMLYICMINFCVCVLYSGTSYSPVIDLSVQDDAHQNVAYIEELRS